GMGEALDEVRKFFDDRDSYFVGKEEGEANKMTEVINKMLKTMSVEMIAGTLEMSVEEVKKYIK
ncbi:MAG: hypothetical protein HUJ53_04695, partial [Holdemanella sp.]|nr:hypothetical protein [Holdemanella sp.]